MEFCNMELFAFILTKGYAERKEFALSITWKVTFVQVYSFF